MSDAKRTADKYIGRDGGPPVTSVPKVRVRREERRARAILKTSFFCSVCGKEEKIFAGAPAGYVPTICVACGRAQMEKSKQFVADLTRQIGELIPVAHADLQERKIAANEGRIDRKQLAAFDHAFEKLVDIHEKLLARDPPIDRPQAFRQCSAPGCTFKEPVDTKSPQGMFIGEKFVCNEHAKLDRVAVGTVRPSAAIAESDKP
jgi:hypothetical protein